MVFRFILLTMLAVPLPGTDLLLAQSGEEEIVRVERSKDPYKDHYAIETFVAHLERYGQLDPDHLHLRPLSQRDRSVLFEVFIDIPELGEVRATTMLFDPGSVEIAPDHQAWLEHYASAVLRYPEVHVRVEAHTDSIGPERDNQVLSEQRAAVVETILLDHGLDRDRLQAVGFGERFPIEPNRTLEGRLANRRVEFRTYFPVKRR